MDSTLRIPECLSVKLGFLIPVVSGIGAGGGGRYFRNFWVGVCRWDPETLILYQSYSSQRVVQLNFATLYQTKLPKYPPMLE